MRVGPDMDGVYSGAIAEYSRGSPAGRLLVNSRNVKRWLQSASFQSARNKGKLITPMRRACGVAPTFRTKKDDPTGGGAGFSPLHAADILAYEVLKLAEDFNRPLPADFQFRFPYRQLEKIPGCPRLLDSDGAEWTRELVSVDRHFAQHPLDGHSKELETSQTALKPHRSRRARKEQDP